MNLLDIFSRREAKNLQKINEIAEELNILMRKDISDISEYSILWFKFNRIETKAHKQKIEFYLLIINSIIDLKIKQILWPK